MSDSSNNANDFTTALPPVGAATVLAGRYAAALFDLAIEQKVLDTAAVDLTHLRTALQQSPEFKKLVHEPRLTKLQRLTIMEGILRAAKLSPLVNNFLKLLARNGRLDILGMVASVFLEKVAAMRGEFTATVATAAPLSQAQQDRLAMTLRELAGGKVRLELTQDASLLGGLTVRLGSQLIDASIRSKLERLQRRLISPSSDLQQGAA